MLARVTGEVVAASGGQDSKDRDQRGKLIWCRVTADQTNRYGCRFLHLSRVGAGRIVRSSVSHSGGIGHSGMFPCFFGGSVSRLLRRAARPRITQARVWDGEITEST